MAPIDPSQVSEAAPAATVEPQAAPAQHRAMSGSHAEITNRARTATMRPRASALPGRRMSPVSTRRRSPAAIGLAARRDDHRHPKGERAAKSGGEHRRRRDDTSVQDDNGSHMPAFLLRPVPVHLIKRKKESEPV